MAETAQKLKWRPTTWVWMVLALLTVAGFLTWLGLASEPSTVAVVEEEDRGDELTDEELAGGLIAVDRDSLGADKAAYEGQAIRVAGVLSSGALGPGIFWGELGTAERQVPILVRLDPGIAGFDVQAGSRYTITGTVRQMADSIAEAWGEAGEFSDESGQLQAAFMDYYIQASNIRPSPPEAGGRGAESGRDE